MEAHRPTPGDLRRLAETADSPCASLVVPIVRGHDAAHVNALRWTAAVEAVVGRLAAADEAAASACARALAEVSLDLRALAPATRALAVYWRHGEMRTLELPVQASPVATVGRSFHLRPLVDALAADRAYRLLALSVNAVALYDGDVWALRPASCPGLPRSMSDALGSELVGGGIDARGSGTRATPPVVHGYGGADMERSRDLERFHHAVARALEALKPVTVPLVLAADQSHQGPFRAAAKLPALLPGGVVGNPDHLAPHELHARSWPLVAAHAAEERRALQAEFEHARNLGKTSGALDAVVPAAVAGRVRRLYVARDYVRAGRLDEAEARVRDEHGGDAVDDVIALVLRRGGEVLLRPAVSMPAPVLVAAELR